MNDLDNYGQSRAVPPQSQQLQSGNIKPHERTIQNYGLFSKHKSTIRKN